MSDQADTIRVEYAIPDPRFDEFKARIDRLTKRAEKLGLPPVGFTETGTSLRKLAPEKGRLFDRSVVIHHVEMFGARPHLGGWRFCGKLEHIPGTTDVIIKELNERDVPVQYRTCEPNCDHCKTNRNRKDTFVIRSIETGDYQQIGRSCLNDFFGGQDPEAVAAFFEFMQDGQDRLRDLEDWDEDGQVSPHDCVYEPERVLEYAAAAIRGDGCYVSASTAEAAGLIPTGHLVRANLTLDPQRLSKNERLEVQEPDRACAREVLAWLRSEQVANRDETYFRNLRVMTNAEAVSYRNIGLFASAIAAFERDKRQRETQDAAATSTYVGTPGEKIELRVTLLGTHVIPGGQYGDKVLHRFLDDSGNLLVWFCSGYGEPFVKGDHYHIRGTVKKHERYRDVDQTTLERVTCPDMKVFAWISEAVDVKTFTKKFKAMHDVNVRESRWGRTPLLEAVIWDREDIARELLKAGASLDAKCEDGTTAEAARPELYARLRSEGLLQNWVEPEPGTQYGFIRCEATNTELLRSFGVRIGPFDETRQGVMAEVSAAALAQLGRFPADFPSQLTAFDRYDDDAMRAFVQCQTALSPIEDLRALWQAKLVEPDQAMVAGLGASSPSRDFSQEPGSA